MVDKREIKDFPKSRQGGTSFIRKTLYGMQKYLMVHGLWKLMN